MLHATITPACAATYRAPGGPWDQPSLDALLSDGARRAGARTVLVDGDDVRRSGEALLADTARLAGALAARGVGPADAVAWQLPNCIEAVLLYRACWRLGAVATPLHHAFGASEAGRLIAAVEPKVVATAEFVQAALTGRVAGHREPWPDGDVLGAAIATSGTSGTPKVVLHTQHTLAYKARLMAAVHDLDDTDVVLMPAPLAHISGLLNGITVAGAASFATVLMSRWDAERALDLIERERVTFMVGPPTFFVSLMQARGFASDRVASLRLVSSGGAGVRQAFVEEAEQRLGCTVKRTYGSTEAPSVATSRTGDGDAAHRHDGRAIGEVELRVNPSGELLVRGPEVCVGYLDRAHNQAFTDDGWYRSGDLATIDAEGWLTIVGRVNDVIIRGGENIAAAEVEAVLVAHDDVREAVVVGFPDALMGERVCAFVTGAASFDLAECRAWFVQQGAAKFKTPERVVHLEALPLLATGKPDRAALRDQAAAG